MKIECVKDKIAESVSIAEKISGKNLTLPVLNNILLRVNNGKFTIKSTNLDIGIEITIPCKVEKDGTTAVPGSVLYNIISTIYDSNKIKLEIVSRNLIISTQSSRAVVKTLPHDDFPTIPYTNNKKDSVQIKTKDFIYGLKSVWYSASTSLIKQELSSVYVYYEDGKLIFVSTDSFRLAEKIIIIKNKIENFEPVLIPLSNITEIIKVLEYIDGDVDLNINNNQISFSSNNVYLMSRVINGHFPDYKQIIPKEKTTEAVVLKQDIINTLKNVNVFSNKFNQVNFSINPKEKFFTINSKNETIGEVTNTLDAAVSGESININFNHKYIADCFQSINSDSVSFEFSGLSKPLIIKGVGDNSFFYLVMPMNK